MKKILAVGIACTLLMTVFYGCKKESDTFTSAALSDYYPFQVGRAYIYRMDSTVPFSFGSSLAVRSYQAKDSVESTFTDNQGRLSYRIWRFIRDTAAKQPWRFSSTFFATPTRESVEYVDNNLRFLKLKLPIKEDYSWYGHAFINTTSQFQYLGNGSGSWQYTYNNLDMPYSVLNKLYDSTVTVAQNDETTPPGPFDPNLSIQIRTFGKEVYAKGIGLIYKDFLYYSYQQNPPPAHFEDNSYGVTLRLISYY